MALKKSQTTASIDVATARLHAEKPDEVCNNVDTGTLKLFREEKFPCLQPLGSGEFSGMDKVMYGNGGPPRLWKGALLDAAGRLELRLSKIDHTLHVYPTSGLQQKSRPFPPPAPFRHWSRRKPCLHDTTAWSQYYLGPSLAPPHSSARSHTYPHLRATRTIVHVVVIHVAPQRDAAVGSRR